MADEALQRLSSQPEYTERLRKLLTPCRVSLFFLWPTRVHATIRVGAGARFPQVSQIIKRFETLDSWRGIAALTIAIYHFSPTWGGYLALDFFFVLSGFVLSHTYLYRPAPTTTWRFICRRLARLYPYHVVSLLAFIALRLSLGRGLPSYEDGTLATFIEQLTLTQNIGLNPRGLTWNYPSWSVSVEFWVNIVFVIWISKATRSILILLVALAGLVVVYVNTGHLETQAANYYGFVNSGLLRGLSGFLLGVLAYRVYLRLHEKERWSRTSSHVKLLAVAVAAAVIFARAQKVSALDFVAPFAFVVMVVAFAEESGFLSRLLRRLRYLGTISYSVYLNQIVVGALVWHLLPSLRDTFYIRLGVFLGALLVISHFTFHFCERPLRSRINRMCPSSNDGFLLPDRRERR